MGRIQRKKPSVAKKKKKQTIDKEPTAQSQFSDARAPQQAPSIEDAAKENKKKLILPQKKLSTAPSPAAVKPRDNILTKSMQFLREVKVELKKVTWPSRKQTIGSTVVVIALVMIISLFLGVVDLGISNLVRIVLQ